MLPHADASKVTRLLQGARDGEPNALNELLPLLSEELRRMAAARMRNERRDHTLDPTALVHEVFLRLAAQPSLEWQDRAHFLGVAALAMRRVLVDHARAKHAEKRGGGRARVTLQDELVEHEDAVANSVDYLDLEQKLELLRAQHERRARVVELRFFGGLTFEESAHVLDVSAKTVEADWYFARAWLRRELRAGD